MGTSQKKINPGTQGETGSKDEVNVQKKLNSIVGTIKESKGLPKNITEQLSFTCDLFLTFCEKEEIYFENGHVYFKDEWLEISSIDLTILLTGLAIRLGVEKSKVKRKATSTKLFSEFSYQSSMIVKNKNFKKSAPEVEVKQNTPLIMADEYVKKAYPNTKYNIISESIDFGIKNKVFDDVFTELGMRNIKISSSVFDTYLRSDKIKKYDPFKEYFKKLPKWDRKSDYIKKLATHVKTENQEFWEIMFEKHLIRSVGQAMGDGKVVNRYVNVLVSPKESIGKTTFIRYLNPFKGEYYTEQTDSDLLLALTKNFILNMEEIESMTSQGFNKLKATISTDSTSMRTLYTQNFKNRVRRASFWASTNNTEFLGGGENTRWLIHKILNIDFGYSNKIDINKVWAQAYHLYNSSFDYNLTQKEKGIAKGISRVHKFKSHEAEFITHYLQPSKTETATATDVTRYLQQYSKGSFNAQRIGTALTGMEYKKKLLNGISQYYIETINGSPVSDSIKFNEKNGLHSSWLGVSGD